MRRVIILFLLAAISFFLLVEQIAATPAPGFWERIIFIGSNDEYYYCLSIQREYPSSYFYYSERVYLKKYQFDGKLVENIPLRYTSYYHDPNLDQKEWTWEVKDTISTEMNIMQYLIKEKVHFAFPSHELEQYELSIVPNYFLIKSKQKQVILADIQYLENFFHGQTLQDDEGGGKVLEYYVDKKNFYFKIEMGDIESRDMYWQQAIIPVPKETVSKISEITE
jgi:hypothetical protein